MKISMILGLTLALFLVPILAHADSHVISPVAFLPLDNNALYEAESDYIYVKATSPTLIFTAPVQLPQGAQITSVVVFYSNLTDTVNLSIALIKTHLYTQAETVMASWTSSGNSFGYASHKISPVIGGYSVNNNGYAYTVRFQVTDPHMGSNVKLHKVKILYN